jgi:molybdenum cofactor cytidylyltransferase
MTTYRNQIAIIKSSVTHSSSALRKVPTKCRPYAGAMTTTAVLLAAGGGSRFKGQTHKLLAPIGGRPVFRMALDHLLEAGFDSILVVTGAVALDIDDASVTIVHNEQWQQGQAGSLQLALTEAGRRGSECVVVGLADQPFVPATAWLAIARAESSAPIVVATYDGVRGPNPVRLQRSVWPLLPTEGDEGARAVMRLHPEWIDELACEGSPADIDTLEDLGAWTNF